MNMNITQINRELGSVGKLCKEVCNSAVTTIRFVSLYLSVCVC